MLLESRMDHTTPLGEIQISASVRVARACCTCVFIENFFTSHFFGIKVRLCGPVEALSDRDLELACLHCAVLILEFLRFYGERRLLLLLASCGIAIIISFRTFIF